MGRVLAYAALAVALILFGFAGLFSIGAPFLLTGIVMLVCFPWRRRREVLWPALSGVWGLTLGYLLLAPIGCSTRGTSESLTMGFVSTAATTTCNGVFFDYSGGASYNPPLLPALLVGVLVGAVTIIAVRALLSRAAWAKESS
jgi:hypothetical protein